MLSNVYIYVMAWDGDNCSKCKQRICVTYQVEPAEAWKNVVLNRWRLLCPACFDIEAERAGVQYEFASLSGITWSQTANWRGSKKRRRGTT